MGSSVGWRRVWEHESREGVPDFELDRGISPRGQELEALSEEELLGFIEPRNSETVLDAGCGTGVNVLRLHARVKRVVGMDYALGSLQRCRRRIKTQQIANAELCLSSVAAIPLPDSSVDKILCLSVLQYLDDPELHRVLKEFVRILRPGGVIILHVKNSASLYWLTLRLAKGLKSLLGRPTRTYHVRSFRWYSSALAAVNCRIVDYNSFNLLTLDGVPGRLSAFLQRFELLHYRSALLRLPFVRRHGADLKIKAVVERGAKNGR
jgi:ubiquinone/menaquinone biosynthesis C-methylase UbiE